MRAPVLLLRVLLMASASMCGFMFAASAWAEGDNAAALFRLQSSVQRLTQENEELKAQLQAREAELANLAGKSGAAANAPAAAKLAAAHAAQLAQANARYQSNVDTLNAAVERSRVQVLELAAKYRELASTLRKAESERARAAEVGVRHLQHAQACEKQNEALRTLSLEVLGRYEHKGFWQALAEKEPFTQIERAKLDNEVDEYRHRIEDLYADVGGQATTIDVPEGPPGSFSPDEPPAP